MRRLRPAFLVLACLAFLLPAPLAAQRGVRAYRAAADSLIRAATRDSAAYRRLGELVDGFGSRPAGSPIL
jgi:hypothetical protein